MFSSPIHFHTSLNFAGKAGAYQSGNFKEVSALLANIILVWKQTGIKNALAYYNTLTIIALMSLIVKAPVANTGPRGVGGWV